MEVPHKPSAALGRVTAQSQARAAHKPNQYPPPFAGPRAAAAAAPAGAVAKERRDAPPRGHVPSTWSRPLRRVHVPPRSWCDGDSAPPPCFSYCVKVPDAARLGEAPSRQRHTGSGGRRCRCAAVQEVCRCVEEMQVKTRVPRVLRYRELVGIASAQGVLLLKRRD
jgi:hypothetical protein